MATSDLHMHLLAWDYFSDRPCETVGLARTASLIEAARKEVPGALLFDNGDFLQGTPMGDFAATAARAGNGSSHPMVRAMNVLGYDAVALGNHEFDYGLEVLENVLGQASFPMLAANISWDSGPAIRPWVLLPQRLRDAGGQWRRLTLGVIGLLPPQIMLWHGDTLKGRMHAECMLQAARREVPAMRAAGADIVLALAHSGLSGLPETPGMENAVIPLAGIDGIDAVIAGHLHRQLPGPEHERLPGVDAQKGLVNGKPVVMPGFAGSHLGLIDLALEQDKAGWRVAQAASSLRPIARQGTNHKAEKPTALVADAAPLAAAVAQTHADTLDYTRKPVGECAHRIHSYFSLLAPCPTIAAINAAQLWYGTRALAAQTGLPILSAASAFKAGGYGGSRNFTDVPPGEITVRNIADIYPFPNKIRAVEISGAALKDWLERAAGVFNRLQPGQPDQPLASRDFARYDFDVISGVEWQIDLSPPALYAPDGTHSGSAGRIRELRYQGRPISSADRFIVMSNSHRIGGSAPYDNLAGAQVVLQEQTPCQEVLRAYLTHTGRFEPVTKPGWRFADLGGVSALTETGPAALECLTEISSNGPQLKPLGLNQNGFALLRVVI